jgi:hypothetical protein
MTPALVGVDLILKLVLALLPSGIAIANDIKLLFKKYSDVTPEQFAAITQLMASTADATYDKLIADIKADQAAHPSK